MATLLKNNIMEIVCRICLKMNKTRFNIFQHSHNDKLISDLIMEYTPIKVQKNDGLPVHICNNCIEKLKLLLDFITMALQSDARLHSCKSKLALTIKEERPNIKDEDMELMHNFVAFDDTNTSELPMNYSSIKHVCDPLHFQKVLIKEENAAELTASNDTIYNSSEESSEYSGDQSNSCSQEDSIINTEKGISEENLLISLANEFSNQGGIVVEQTENSAMVQKKYDKSRTLDKHVNEKQAALLDNADYNRIKQMGLSKKEKENMPVYCNYCNKTFNFRYFVGIHAHIHTGNLPFKCEKCDTRFPKKSVLNQHMRTHIETRDFSCDVCGKTFTTIYCLRSHKLVHSDEKSYKCNICDKTFKQSLGLQRHLMMHNNVRNHICEMCGKAYVNKSRLLKHQVIHTVVDDKEFVCEICKKKFSLKRSLDAHMKTHSTEKPYVCKHCGKSFLYNTILQHHLLIHTGEKPHACKLCGKKFRQRSCIMRHMRIHTGETPYPCEYCTSSFKYKHHLLNHMKVHEKESGDK